MKITSVSTETYNSIRRNNNCINNGGVTLHKRLVEKNLLISHN